MRQPYQDIQLTAVQHKVLLQVKTGALQHYDLHRDGADGSYLAVQIESQRRPTRAFR